MTSQWHPFPELAGLATRNGETKIKMLGVFDEGNELEKARGSTEYSEALLLTKAYTWY